MNSVMKRFAVALAVAIAPAAEAQSNLVGDTITVSRSGSLAIGPASAVVGDGAEFYAQEFAYPGHGPGSGSGSYYGFLVDFGANDVTIWTFGDSGLTFSFGNFNTRWAFTNTSSPFTSISYMGSDPDMNVHVWYSPGQINVAIPDDVSFRPGRSTRYAIPGIPGVPEPGSAVLGGLAACGVAHVARRRRSVRTSQRIGLAASLLACLAVAGPANAAVMEGHRLQSTTWSNWPHGLQPVFDGATYVVSPIVELIDFNGFLDIDVSDTNILITASVDRAVGDPQYLDFEDVYRTIPRIVGVTVNPETTWEGFDDSRVSFNPNWIRVRIRLPATAGQRILLDVATLIPEPASGLLSALAITFLAAAARGARRRASVTGSPANGRVKLPLLMGAAWMAAPLTASAVTMSWVQVGAPGNPGASYEGAVPYEYRIGKYDVTVSQYVEFLNAKDATGSNVLGIYKTGMSNATYGGVSFDADAADGSKYGVIPGRENHPINYVTWYDAIRFANWLNNGQGDGDTETGAYTLGALGDFGVPLDGTSIARNQEAVVHLPSFAEWTKAAYYDGLRDRYFDYPTSRNAEPTARPPTDIGNSVNAANVVGNVTDVGAYTGTTSPWGAYDMAGNVAQWTDDLNVGLPPLGPRLVGGSGFDSHILTMSYFSLRASGPTNSRPNLGMRMASRIPEPGACALAVMAAGAIPWRRGKRRTSSGAVR